MQNELVRLYKLSSEVKGPKKLIRVGDAPPMVSQFINPEIEDPFGKLVELGFAKDPNTVDPSKQKIDSARADIAKATNISGTKKALTSVLDILEESK